MAGPYWVHSIGKSAEVFSRKLCDEAGAADLELGRKDAGDANGGIIVLDPGGSTVLDEVSHTISVQGGPVIVVAVKTPAQVGFSWECLREGVIDVVSGNRPMPDILRDLRLRLERLQEIQAVLRSDLVTQNLIGKSTAWITALRRVVETALYANQPVLLTGASGTGKELCARLIHSLMPEGDRGELVIVDSTTLNPELSGSELFGHERGAYTGAIGARQGAFELAHEGTLFLDEIGELDRNLQALLLRVIQEGRYKPIGGNTWKNSDFRFVSATNRDLAKEVVNGRFRADLYHRILGQVIALPPLDDRAGDVALLSRHFLRKCLPGCAEADFDPLVMDLLCARSYPGNVRELKQIIQRIALRYTGTGPVTPGMVPGDLRPKGPRRAPAGSDPFDRAAIAALHAELSLKDIAREATDAAVRQALSQCDGNIAQAARRLAVTPRALQLRKAGQRENGGDHEQVEKTLGAPAP